MSNPLPYCYLNGDIESIDSASISVLDRGFIFGDAVYEVVPVFDGKIFLLDRHLARLARSLSAIQIATPHTNQAWSEIFRELISRNGAGDQSIYLQVSRGVAPRDHVMPERTNPTVMAFCSELRPSPIKPARAITLADIRWGRCDIKSTSLLANVMFKTQAKSAGADEAILIRSRKVTEGAASNVFVYHQGCVKTPPLSAFILPGVTRDFLLEALIDSEFAAQQCEISSADLHEANEIWCTSSSRELFPVVALDGNTVGTGEVFEAVRSIYDKAKRRWLEDSPG